MERSHHFARNESCSLVSHTLSEPPVTSLNAEAIIGVAQKIIWRRFFYCTRMRQLSCSRIKAAARKKEELLVNLTYQ